MNDVLKNTLPTAQESKSKTQAVILQNQRTALDGIIQAINKAVLSGKYYVGIAGEIKPELQEILGHAGYVINTRSQTRGSGRGTETITKISWE